MKVKKLLAILITKIRGHANYYGIVGNSVRVGNFKYFALKIWRKWLSRRSNRGYYTMLRFENLLKLIPYHVTKSSIAKP